MIDKRMRFIVTQSSNAIQPIPTEQLDFSKPRITKVYVRDYQRGNVVREDFMTFIQKQIMGSLRGVEVLTKCSLVELDRSTFDSDRGA